MQSPVTKVIAVLAHVARASDPVPLADLSRAVRLPKPTAHRVAKMLEQLSLIAKDPLTRRYTVGSRLVDLGFHAIRNAPAYRNRRLILERLSEKLGETINLAVLARDEVMYLDRVEAAWPLRTDFQPGSRVPVHCTANGKLLLAYAPSSLRARRLRSLTLTSFTDRTVTNPKQLVEELAEIRRRGYSEDNEEFLAGVCCLAVPVRDRRGRVIAGLAVSAPSARFNLERARIYIPDMMAAAAELGPQLQSNRRDR